MNRTAICVGMSIVLVAMGATWASATVTLRGDTSRPRMSTFGRGEPVKLNFNVSHLVKNESPVSLDIDITNAENKLVDKQKIRVESDAHGHWQGSISAPAKRLGFYRVNAKLSNGVTLKRLGSRPEGFITYCVVPDPSKRKLYPPDHSFFGMPVGSRKRINLPPYLGVRWVLNGSGKHGYSWGAQEPDHAGQFAEKIIEAKAKGKSYPDEDWAWPYVMADGRKRTWKVYTLPSLYLRFNKNNPWQLIPGTYPKSVNGGALQNDAIGAWRNYCELVGKVYSAHHPDRPHRIYQITWEPVNPWGYKGTKSQLVQIYKIAYAALHAADPRAVVIGPTYGSASLRNDSALRTLFADGLGKYIDGYAVHPYIGMPPERHGLIEAIEQIKQMLHQYMGHAVPLFGTEQGYNTRGKVKNEIIQARGLVRTNLIMMGEGFRFNFAFCGVDYRTRSGHDGDYGFYYNLDPKLSWVSHKVGPKPIAPAYAAMTYLLAGHKSAGPITWLGDTAVGYAYETYKSDGPVKITLALWDTSGKPHKVAIPVGRPQVKVYDWMGNERVMTTDGGTLHVTLTRDPIYIQNVSPKMWSSGAHKPLTIKTSRVSAYPGNTIVVHPTIAATLGQPIDGQLVVQADPALGIEKITRPIHLKTDASQALTLPLTVSSQTATGAYSVRLTLKSGGKAIAAGGLIVSVQPPVKVISAEPSIDASQGKTVRVTLEAVQDKVFTGTLIARLKGMPESRRLLKLNLAGHQTTTVVIPYAKIDAPAKIIYPLRLTIQADNGYRFETTKKIDFLFAQRAVDGVPILAGKAQQAEAVHLSGRGDVVRSVEDYSGPQDQSATIHFAWDAKNLYMKVRVHDDVFLQTHTGWATWKQDCIQLGIDLDPGWTKKITGNVLADKNTRRRYSEISLALTPQGPQAYRTHSFNSEKYPVALIPASRLQLKVQHAKNEVTYFAAIPWKTIGVLQSPKAGQEIGVALAINDADSPKQREPSALGLFSGIYPTKDPNLFGQLVLQAK